MLRLVEKADAREEASEYQSLDELAREGARRMLVGALEAEVSSYLERHADDFRMRAGFTYTVLDRPSGDVVGCVYIYPVRGSEHDARVGLRGAIDA